MKSRSMSVNTKICLVLPSFSAGGMERVMSELARYFSISYDVVLILLTRGDHFYEVPANVKVFEPGFLHTRYGKLQVTLKTLLFFRRQLAIIKPDVVLSFGGRYNSFVLLGTFGLCKKVFVSDRSRPGISYGWFIDFVNSFMYRFATGLVAQTQRAKDVLVRVTAHRNIAVIGNPIRPVDSRGAKREKIVLNVGRFIATKKQSLLIEYFAKLNCSDWRLVFVGDGAGLEECRVQAIRLGIGERVLFVGNTRNVDEYYLRSSIFAFTSVSEGFPNALGEAMSAGLACVSFDCVAGPSDLIEDGVDGFLVPMYDDERYLERLKLLMESEDHRIYLGRNAMEKVKQFSIESIGKRYLDFMC